MQREIGTLTTIVARYDDLIAVIRDDKRFSIENPVVAGTERFNVFWDTPTLAHRDPPVHTRLRRMVAPSFAPRKIDEMEPAVRAMVGRLLDSVAGQAEFDTVKVLGDQLPMMVFGHMLNVPEKDFSSIRKLEDVTHAIGALKPGKPIPAEFTKSLDDLRAYFFDYIEKRRANVGNDLLSAIITAHDEKGSLNQQELLGMVWVLLLGGLSTTADMISYIIYDLLTHPDQLELVRREPKLIPGAVEESLRYDPPVHTHIRFATNDTELGRRQNSRRYAGVRGAGRRQLRPSEVQGSGKIRYPARLQRPSFLRRGHPLLYRRRPGPIAGTSGAERDAQTLPAPASGGRFRATVQRQRLLQRSARVAGVGGLTGCGNRSFMRNPTFSSP